MKSILSIPLIVLLALTVPYSALASTSTSEVHTVITANNGGTSVVDIQTSTNGEVHTEHIEKTIPAGGTVEINYATSSYSAGTVGTSSTRVLSAARIRANRVATTSASTTKPVKTFAVTFHQNFSVFSNILSSLFGWLKW